MVPNNVVSSALGPAAFLLKAFLAIPSPKHHVEISAAPRPSPLTRSLPSSQYPAAEVVNFGTWFLFSFPISLIMLVVSWFWIHWLFLGCK